MTFVKCKKPPVKPLSLTGGILLYIIYRGSFYSETFVESPGTASGGVTGSVVL